MIAKPCPECGKDNAQCGCPIYWITECRDCGAIVIGRKPKDGCEKCTESWEFTTK